MNKIAIAILTRKPSSELISFYKKMIDKDHDLFIIVDDNNHKISNHDNITYIYSKESDCIKLGYTLFNPQIPLKTKDNEYHGSSCSAWEKALMYFCTINRKYGHVWFIEDDVFIPKSSLVSEIDKMYPLTDLLCPSSTINKSGRVDDWYWWDHVPKKILPLPWSNSMVCAVRMSNKLLSIISSFTEKNKAENKMIEYIFTTLALHNKLEIKTIKQLAGIVWRKEWKINEIDENTFYHPIKSIARQEEYRRNLIQPRQLRMKESTRFQKFINFILRNVNAKYYNLKIFINRKLK